MLSLLFEALSEMLQMLQSFIDILCVKTYPGHNYDIIKIAFSCNGYNLHLLKIAFRMDRDVMRSEQSEARAMLYLICVTYCTKKPLHKSKTI